MRLLIALAFLAMAAAMPEPKAIELPAPASPTVTQQTKDTTVVANPTSTKVDTTLLTNAAVKPEAVKIETPALTVEISPEVTKEAMKPTNAEDVKVVPVQLDATPKVAQNEPDLSKVHVHDLPVANPEAMRRLFPDPMSLIDIRPLLVPQEVMRQLSQMATQDTNAVNVGGANPFSFENAEPLDNVERVNVVDTPVNQLDAKMNPVIVVDTQTGDQAPFAAEAPEMVKVVDIGDQIIPVDMMRPVPVENWRGPPQMTQENWRAPPQIPQENWRVPPQIPHIWREYRPVPPFYREIPGNLRHGLPKYKDAMLR